MDLMHQVMSNLEVPEGKAEKGVGAILMALRMSVDKDTFEKAKQAIPHAERMMGHSLMSGGRTGEMAMMAGPGALIVSLAAAGFDKETCRSLRGSFWSTSGRRSAGRTWTSSTSRRPR